MLTTGRCPKLTVKLLNRQDNQSGAHPTRRGPIQAVPPRNLAGIPADGAIHIGNLNSLITVVMVVNLAVPVSFDHERSIM